MQYTNFGLGIAFVKQSATISAVPIWENTTSPSVCQFLMTCCSTTMYFVLAGMMGFLMMLRQPAESVMMGVAGG
jgi:hypothetical protein